MSEYRAPIKDALFTLRHIGELEQLSGTDLYAHADPETVAAVLEEQGRFMQEVFGPTNAIGDTVGLKWTPEGVETPEEFKPAYAKFVQAGMAGAERPHRVRRGRVPRGRAGLRARVLHRRQRRAHHGAGADHRRHRAAPGVGHRGAEGGLPPQAGHRRVDRHHEPDRAAGRLGRGAVDHQGGPGRRRHLQDHRHQDLHLVRRARHGREHHPPGARPPARGASRHQGDLAVHRARSSW